RPDTGWNRERALWNTIVGLELRHRLSFQGEPLMHRYNFAARAARWSAEHWKTAVAVWVAFVAVAIGVGTTVGTHMLSVSEQSTGETARAEQILASAGFKTPASESVLVRSSTRTVADPAFRSTVQSVLPNRRSSRRAPNRPTAAAARSRRTGAASRTTSTRRGGRKRA